MNFKKLVVGTLAALALTAVTPASPAFAINEVGCGDRWDYLRLEYMNGRFGSSACFANAGTRAVDVRGVYEITTGNYKATINYENGGRYHTVTKDPHTKIVFSGTPSNVYEVRIW